MELQLRQPLLLSSGGSRPSSKLTRYFVHNAFEGLEVLDTLPDLNPLQRMPGNLHTSIVCWARSSHSGVLHIQRVLLTLLAPAAVCIQPLSNLLNHITSLLEAQHLQVQHLKCREHGLTSPQFFIVAFHWPPTI